MSAPMSDDLRERIARALADHNVDASRVGWESRTMGWYRDAADAVLAAVVRPVIKQAEQERDEAARFGESTQDWLRARVATLEAALDRIAHHPITQSSDAVTLRQIARDALDEQDTTPAPPPWKRCPTCRSDDPARQQGLPHTDLHAQVRCRDPWHSAAPPVEEKR